MKIKNKIFIFFYLTLIINLSINNLNAEIPLYKLNAIKISYKDNNKVVFAEGQAYAVDQFGREIFSDLIIYDKSKNVIKTKNNSKYRDKKGNKIDADTFLYDLKLNKIIAKNNVKYEEIKGNIIYFSEFEYFDNSNKGFGKNAKALMIDKSSFESEYLNIDNNLGTIVINSNQKKINFIDKLKSLFSKGNNYTTCKNIENSPSIKEQCPDWSLSTFKTRHDSKKKMVYHDHAIIKIRNIPVFYTPYFSHPDPTEKRKTGFLTPSTKNFTNLGRTYRLPFFWAIDEENDLTITPIFYKNENDIYLTEYRRQNKNSLISIDTSYSSGYRNLNKTSDDGEDLNRTGGSRNHFFLNFFGQYENNILLGNNDLDLKIQRISQKNYLNVNQINTELVKQDISQLTNSLTVNSYKDNERLKISTSVYENLSIDDPNIKYQYKIPHVEYTNFFNKFDHLISASSLIEANNYNADTKKIIQRNVIQADSKQKIFKKIGASNTIKIKTSNLNYYNEEVLGAKPNMNNELYTTVALDTSLPLIRSEKNIQEILTPKIFTKHTTGAMKNESSLNKILNYSDIYSLDRLENIDNPETGSSIGYGFQYELNKKNSQGLNFLDANFSLGQVLTDSRNSKMPTKSSLNNKSSNIVGDFNFNINKSVFNLKKNNEIKNKLGTSQNTKGVLFSYSYNISNDLNKILKNDLNVTFSDGINKISTKYYELHDIGNQQYIETNIQKSFNNNLNLLIGARKNLELEYTENNYIEANYESDCLKIGLSLSKQFYENEDIKKSNNLTLFLTLKPFGQPIAPDLTSFISND